MNKKDLCPKCNALMVAYAKIEKDKLVETLVCTNSKCGHKKTRVASLSR